MQLSRFVFAIALGSGLAASSQPADACGDGKPHTPVRFAARPYSAGAMQDALAALEECNNTHGKCEPRAVIKSWGKAAVPTLIARANEATDWRATDLYRFAVDVGGKSAFDRLVREFAKTTDEQRAQLVFDGMRIMPAETLAYFERELPRTRDPMLLAQLALQLSNETTGEPLFRMTQQAPSLRTKIMFARATLADTRYVNDRSLWALFMLGLTSTDEELRSEAAGLFPVSLVPPAQRAQFLAIYEADVTANRRKLDRSNARDMFTLGSIDPAVIDTLFGGIESDNMRERYAAGSELRRNASRLSTEMKAKYAARIEELLATATDATFKRVFERTLGELRR